MKTTMIFAVSPDLDTGYSITTRQKTELPEMGVTVTVLRVMLLAAYVETSAQ